MLNTNKSRTVDGIMQDLLRHLSEGSLVTRISEQFSSLKSNPERVDFAYKLLEGAQLFPAVAADEKSNEVAASLRRQGNESFKFKKNQEAIELYTQSIAFAENNSECLALAYANRSAVLLKAGLYKESLMDIDRALSYNYPENLKSKVLARQKKATQLIQDQIPLRYHQSIPKIPEDQSNTLIQCAKDSVQISYTEELGRHIVATRDILIGEIIAVERPFCHILIDQLYTHCHECLDLCYNLIPCSECTQVMYCSEKCRDKAVFYHKYECPLVATMKVLKMDKLKLLPVKIALVVKDEYRKILSDGYSLNESDVYRSDSYREIHNLVANTESRSVSDLFARSVTTAVMFQLFKANTDFFNDEVNETMFKDIVLLHLQTAACNFHEISEMAENRDSIYALDEIGAGAYSFMSMFNHSCSPNVVRHCYGPLIVLRAIQSIRQGEQCYDNYGYHYALMNRDDRRTKLKSQYFFDCACEVCKDDWPLYQDLPDIKTDIDITSNNLEDLQKGDVNKGKEVILRVLPKCEELQRVLPNKNFAEAQEVIKQCFALIGNVRKPLK